MIEKLGHRNRRTGNDRCGGSFDGHEFNQESGGHP